MEPGPLALPLPAGMDRPGAMGFRAIGPASRMRILAGWPARLRDGDDEGCDAISAVPATCAPATSGAALNVTLQWVPTKKRRYTITGDDRIERALRRRRRSFPPG